MNNTEYQNPKFETTIIIREDLNNPDLEEILQDQEENTLLAYTLLTTLSFLIFNIMV